MQNIERFTEFDNHVKVHEIKDARVGLKGFIAIHRKRKKFPSLGATRLWNYRSEKEAISDALRLARMMTYKSVGAGLPYGGAKAVLMLPKSGISDRKDFFETYARHVNELDGEFVTGSDVGVNDEDVRTMRSQSPYIIGNNVPAARYTSLGVFNALKIYLEVLAPDKKMQDCKITIQGIGKTGYELARSISDKAKKITVSDINRSQINRLKQEFGYIRAANPNRIHRVPTDIYCPCALSYAINNKTVNELCCQAVIGSANNQLASLALAKRLHERNIVYLPDYVVNSGGIISVVDQYEHGKHNQKRVTKQLQKIKVALKKILQSSIKNDQPPVLEANAYVENILAKE